jgi:ABC-type dipeptide/oligopeptide/nickel transport system ATPase component
MPSDPIQLAVNALNVLVTVQNTPPYKATDTALYATVKTAFGLLFNANVSADLVTVSQDINKALNTVVTVIGQISTTLTQIQKAGGDATNAMAALQQGLSMAQTLSPGGASTALDSASQLFATLQNLLTAVGVAQAATELGELASQLTDIAQLFPTS